MSIAIRSWRREEVSAWRLMRAFSEKMERKPTLPSEDANLSTATSLVKAFFQLASRVSTGADMINVEGDIGN
jgi:hypothetical protein